MYRESTKIKEPNTYSTVTPTPLCFFKPFALNSWQMLCYAGRIQNHKLLTGVCEMTDFLKWENSACKVCFLYSHPGLLDWLNLSPSLSSAWPPYKPGGLSHLHTLDPAASLHTPPPPRHSREHSRNITGTICPRACGTFVCVFKCFHLLRCPGLILQKWVTF